MPQSVSGRKNCEEYVGPLLQQFMEDHKDRMARKRALLLRRAATHCKDSRQIVKMQPILNAHLEATRIEFDIAASSAERIKENLPDALMQSAERAKLDAMADGAEAPAAPAQKSPRKKSGEDDAEPVGPAVSPLDRKSMKLFIRWVTFQIRSHKRLSRFLAKFQWLTHSHRYELLRYSRSLAAAPAPTSQHSPAPAQGIPSMVVTTERLNTLLVQLKEAFSLTADPERDDMQQYCFAVKSLLANLHSAQAADTPLLPYDSSVAGRYIHLHAGASYDERRRRIKADHSDEATSIDKGSVEVTYIKPSEWVKHRKFEPAPDPARDEVLGVLAGIKELDHILGAELIASLEDNLAVVSQRIAEQVETHVERAIAVPDGDGSGMGTKILTTAAAAAASSAGAGPATGGGQQGQRLTKANVQLPLDKLTPLYQMRHLQVRQARRRLLAILNYFRSIERRVTLDARGLAFSSAPGAAATAGEGSGEGALLGGGGATAEEAHRILTGFDPVKKDTEVMGMHGVQSRDDAYFIDGDGVVRVRDAAGFLVMYDAALEDMKRLEVEMMRVGTYYVTSSRDDKAVPDRSTVLLDMVEHEATFYEALKQTVDSLFEAYEHTFSRSDQERLAQELTNTLSQRPLFDLTKPYFTESYKAEISMLNLQGSLLRDVLTGQMLEERMYRNTTIVRNHAIPVQERYGFPEEVYQPSTHDELLGGCAPYTAVPGGYSTGALDLYCSVGGLCNVLDVFRSVTKEMCFVHDLCPARGVSSMTSMATAVLQQGLIEWKLLMEEEDMTEDIGKRFGMIGRRPYANSFLIDDPFAVEKVIDELEKQLNFDAEEEARRKGAINAKGKAGRKAPADVKTVFDELQHPDCSLQAYLNVLEGILNRRELLDAIYETEVLRAAYHRQAEHYSRDISKTGMPALDFGNAGNETSARKQRTEETSALGADFVVTLAIQEFDPAFATFDFQTLEGMQESLGPDAMMGLRHSLRIQVVERGMHALCLEYNSLCMDRAMEAVLELEQQLLSQIAHNTGTAAPKAFAGASATVAATKKQDASELAEKRDKALVEVAKFQTAQALRIRDSFLVIANLKNARRTALLERFVQRSALIQGAGLASKKQVRALKLELISTYGDSILADMEPYAIKSTIARSAIMLARAAVMLPKPKMVFTQLPDGQATSVQFDRPLEIVDETGKDMSIFGTDLALINGPWRIPHPIEVVTEFPQEPRTLAAYSQIMTAMHDMLCMLGAFAKLMPKPLVQSKERAVGPDYTQQMFGLIKNQVDCLGDQANPFELAKFLMSRRAVTYYLYYLSLAQAHAKLMLSNSATPASLAILNRSITEITAPQFPPPKTFPSPSDVPPQPPVAASTSAAGAKLSAGSKAIKSPLVKGPSPDVPVPPSYASIGSSLLQLPESDRAQVVNEWTKLEGLMADMLQTRGLFLNSAPAACLAHMHEFCRTSSELKSLTEAYVGMMLGIYAPSTPAEIRAFTDCYNSNILSKVLRAKEKADREFSEIQSAALTGQASSADESSKQKLADKAHAEFLALSTELAQRQFACRVLHDEISKGEIRREIDRVNAAHSKMMVLIDEHGFVHEKETLQVKAKEALETKGQEAMMDMVPAHSLAPDSAKREDIIMLFMRRVWEKATEDFSEDGSERRMVMPWNDFYGAIDLLAQQLKTWGVSFVNESLRTLTTENQDLRHRVYVLERNIAHYEATKGAEQTRMARRIDVAVKDQCYALLFKIDSLERRLLGAQKELIEMESTVRERLKIEFEDLVKDLGTQLTMVKSQFKEYRESLQQDMKSNLHDIRKEALMKMVKSGSAPIELKRMTLKMAHTEDTIEDLTIENSELKRALLKVRTMNNIKDLNIRMSYDKRLKAMQAGQLETSKELYNEKAETHKKLEMISSRLDETNVLLAAAESERDRVKKELDLAHKNKQTLLTWKVAKTQLLSELEARVKKYEKWSHVDVDKLQLELERKETELKALQSQDPAELARHRAMIDSSVRKEAEKLRRMLASEQRLKLEAFQKLEAMRADFRCRTAPLIPPPPFPPSLPLSFILPPLPSIRPNGPSLRLPST